MKQIILSIAFIFLINIHTASAQMRIGRDSLFGNEWINTTQVYFKISVANDGMIRLTQAQLAAAGVPNTVRGEQFQIFRNGKEEAIFVSTNMAFGQSDYLQFYGQRNRIEVDSHLYRLDTFYQNKGIVPLLNTDYSVISDTAAYFLTWQTPPSVSRFQTIANNLSNLPTAETWFWHKSNLTFNTNFIKPELGSGVYLPEYQSGEGFATALDNSRILTFALPAFVPNIDPQISLRWAGNNNCHYLTVTHTSSGTTLLTDTTYTYESPTTTRNAATSNGLRVANFNVNAALLNTSFSVQLRSLCGTTDKHAIANAAMTYARSFSFDNATQFAFTIAASNTAKYLEINDFSHNNIAPVLYDLTNNIRIVCSLQGATVRVLLPPSVSPRNLLLVNETAAVSTANPVAVTLPRIEPNAGDYIIITSSRLRTGSTDRIAEYASYRASANGGNFRTHIVNIEDLYNLFGFGINRHPIAIRNFIHYISRNWQGVKFVTIIGKGREYREVRTPAQVTDATSTLYVPTWGYPASDVLLASRQNGSAPVIPIGRIPISEISELPIYLKKVRDLETEQRTAPQTLAARDWQKQILHLAGGAAEAVQIKGLMQDYENSVNYSTWGANVTTFNKTNLDPIQVAQNEAIFNRLNQGVAMTTFFGHSAASSLDFDINNPTNFNNQPKYPLFIALGCSAGNVHTSIDGISENFIFYPDRAMSAFLGTSGLDFLSSLSFFATRFYDYTGNEHFGKSIGELLMYTNRSFDATPDQNLRTVLQEMTLAGDPAIRIHVAAGTDYVPDAAKVRFEPSNISAQLDSFKVILDVVNLGKTDTNKINIQFKLKLTNGQIVDLKKEKITPPQYRGTFEAFLTLPDSLNIVGQNRLFITVDADNNVNEVPNPQAETNNELFAANGEQGIGLFIIDNNAQPVFPLNFGIVNSSPVTLKASTSDALAKVQTYIFELDTLETFNSPFKIRQTITQSGGILKWQPNITWRDSTVYYWRIGRDSVSPTMSYGWQNRSFIYINGSSDGWNQSHPQQLDRTNRTTLEYNNRTGDFAFAPNLMSVEVKTMPTLPNTWNPVVNVNGTRIARNYGIPNAGLYVTILDTLNGLDPSDPVLLNRPAGRFGIAHPQGWHLWAYMFNTTDTSSVTGRRAFINFINNEIPNGYYCIIYSVQQTDTSNLKGNEWANDSIGGRDNIFTMLERQAGATKIRGMSSASRPYVLAFKKGENRAIHEKLANNFVEGVNESFMLTGRWYEGYAKSQLIGPAKTWDRVEADYKINPNDTMSLRIYAVNTNRQDSLIYDGLARRIPIDTLDATRYPYLRLEVYMSDSRQRSAPRLEEWRVLYSGFTDLAVAPNRLFATIQDSIERGANYHLDMAVENVSKTRSDSVLVRLSLRDARNIEHNFQQILPPLQPDSAANLRFATETKDFAVSKYTASVSVNPLQAMTEINYGNNAAQTQFAIYGDIRNPLLDVTFDGQHILNNDIVSPSTNILIELRDENRYLLLNDTALFRIQIENTSIRKTTTLSFNDPSVRFVPATSGGTNNKARIEIKPITPFTDGEYRLIIKAKDASGNVSGANDYVVAFKVITRKAISNVLPYPNPFSTAARFAYILTGDEVPTSYKIQILTVSGKVVRELTEMDLGALRIGSHLTEGSWDGTDTYGNKLANGVYLYKMTAKRANGTSYEAHENSTIDPMFKQGLGKIVLVR